VAEPDRVCDLEGIRIFHCSSEGQPPRNSRDATDLMSAAWNQQATLLVIPEERLGDDFFRLKTGIAGDVLQKFVMYKLQVVIVGDISRYVDQSAALRDFVYECNEGRDIWFLPDLPSLANRLAERKNVVKNELK
jgi:hypothetical protein